MGRYAEGTSVSVEASRAELSAILTRYKVYKQGWAFDQDGDALIFEFDGRSYRFSIPRPTVEDIHRMYPNHRDTDAKLEQEWKRRWRAHVLLLKAKLEFIDGGMTSLEDELMANLLVPGTDQVLSEWMRSDGGIRLLGSGR